MNSHPCTAQHCKEAAAPHLPETFDREPDGALRRRAMNLECLATRSLGPSDLVYIVRTLDAPSGSGQLPKHLHSWHRVLGVDCSSSASIAAHLTRLLASLTNDNGGNNARRTLFGRRSALGWRVTRITFCTYDAFARRDVRVEAHLPGSVRSYQIIDARKRDLTEGASPVDPGQWTRVAICAATRYIIYDGSDECNNDAMMVKTEPDDSILQETLLQAVPLADELWKSGSPDGLRVASLRRNNIMLAVCKYATLNWEFGVQFGERLAEAGHELGHAMQAEAAIAAGQLGRAIQIMKDRAEHHHSCPSMLVLQANLSLAANNPEQALFLVHRAVALAPNDSDLWLQLANLQLASGQQPHNVLWSLNSIRHVGMAKSTSSMMRMAQEEEDTECLSLHVHRPTNGPDLVTDLCSADAAGRLKSLKAQDLGGTARHIYSILCQLCVKLGWDGLLDVRQACFVMEQDYNFYSDADSSSQPPLSPTTRAVQRTEKRVCERWMDDMFGMLYDDLRVFAVFSTELEHVRKHAVPYTRAAFEWAILASLCDRLLKPVVRDRHNQVEMLTSNHHSLVGISGSLLTPDKPVSSIRSGMDRIGKVSSAGRSDRSVCRCPERWMSSSSE